MKIFFLINLILTSFVCNAAKINIKVTIQNLTGDTLLVNFNVGSNVADPSASVFVSKNMNSSDLQWTFETGKSIENYAVVFGSAIIIKNDPLLVKLLEIIEL